ncbi:MAG: signal transduction histidine kinase [Pseudohongiellaceae bacterium]|jgi:signal transduction histidine kinase
MSLRERLTLAIITILVLFSINVATNSWSNNSHKTSMEKLREAIEGQLKISSFEQQLDNVFRTLMLHGSLRSNIQETLTPKQIAKALNDINQLQSSLQRLGVFTNNTNPNNHQRLWKEFIELSLSWKNFYLKVNESDYHHQVDTTGTEERYKKILILLKNQKNAAINIAASQNIELNHTEKITNRITITVFFLSISLTIGLGVILIRYTNKELNILKQGATIIGNGNFDYRIPVKNKDELGAVAESFNIMSGKMKQAMFEVHEAKIHADDANRAKTDFLTNISHELRTPLNAIIGYSEMMLEDLQLGKIDEKEHIKDLIKVLYAGRHLLSHINDVLDFSKIESGNMTIYKERFNPNQILQEVINTIKPLTQKGDNQLYFNNSESTPDMLNDITKFRQIFFNLLSNACKFTHAGEIHLTTQHIDDKVLFIVSDTGIGMSPEQLSVVFDPFIQADTSTTRRYGGTGLGLALCKQYCELVGASIHAESEIEKGSRFFVEFKLEAST